MKDPRRKTPVFFLPPYHGNNPSYQPWINKMDRTQSTCYIPNSIKIGYQGGKKRYTGHQTVFPKQYPSSFLQINNTNPKLSPVPISPSRSPRHVLAIGQLDGGSGKVHAVLFLEGDGVRILRNRGLQHEGTVEAGLVHVSPTKRGNTDTMQT